MKNKKIIIALIIMLIFVSILSLNVFAEDVDYNTVIGINESGENKFYSLEGALGNSRWQDYINYHNSLHSDSPFGVINNLVTYKGYFLRNKTGVLVYANDNVIVASGCVYNVESIFVVENNTFKFNELIGSNITFANLLENIKQTLFTVDYSAQRSFIYYNSCPVLMNSVHVDTSLFIHTDITYTLGSACVHDWRIQNTIEVSTCIKAGSAERECILCGATEIIEVLPDTENGHYWKEKSYTAPTCINTGFGSLICEYCSQVSSEVVEALGHEFTSPTCTEISYCIRCGAKGESELGHDLRHGTWGKCMRDGCDYRLIDVQGALSSVGTNISNWWQGGVLEPVNNGIENVKDWFSEKKEDASDIGENIKQGFKTVLLIIFGAFIIVVLVSTLPLVIKFFDFLSDRKNKRGGKK